MQQNRNHHGGKSKTSTHPQREHVQIRDGVDKFFRYVRSRNGFVALASGVFAVIYTALQAQSYSPRIMIYACAGLLTVVVWIGAIGLAEGFTSTHQQPPETLNSVIQTNVLTPDSKPDPAILEQIIAGFAQDNDFGRTVASRMRETLFAPGVLKIFFGGNIGYTTGASQNILKLGGRDVLSIHRSPAGITIDAIVLDAEGRVIVQVENNQYFPNPTNSFRPETPNPHTFVVRDISAHVVLRIEYLNPGSIVVTGIFRSPGSPTIEVTDDVIKIDGVPRATGNVMGNIGGVFSF